MASDATGLPIRTRVRIGLGTWLAVEACTPNKRQNDVAIEAAFAALRDVEALMHPERTGSELARLNASLAPGGPARSGARSVLRVHPLVWELLALAKRLHAASRGIFDPCLPSLPGCLEDLELLPPSFVRCHRPVKLDFGGFAKGFAVDHAIAALKAHGCSRGLVNAGGDLRVFGSRAEPIVLRQPDGRFHRLELGEAAVAVSDLEEPQRPPEHRGYYVRVADRVAGRALEGNASRIFAPVCGDAPVSRRAVIVAREAVIADALTKCALLCSSPMREQVLEAFDARLVPCA